MVKAVLELCSQWGVNVIGQLEILTLNHLDIVREWRNSEAVNRFMFHQHVISTQEHQDWFEASTKNPLRHLLMYFENELPAGFIQLEKRGCDTDVFEWGFYVSPEASKGTGARMARSVLTYAFTSLKAAKIYAEVLCFNAPSIHLHSKLHFQEEGVLRKQFLLQGNYLDIHCFGLLKEEWQ